MIPPGRPFPRPARRPDPAYFRALLEVAPEVKRRVQGRFPGVCAGVVEESCQEVLLLAWLERPTWEGVWERQGPGRLRGRFQVALWRHVRGWWRRHGRRSVELGPEGSPSGRGGVEPAQELVVRVSRDFEVCLERALQAAGAADTACLRTAVLDGLGSELSEAALAERHGTRREYVNRARNALWREVWA